MDHEIKRILNSEMDHQILNSIQDNEQQIQKMQSLLLSKNSQVYQLQQLIQNELQTTIQENQGLRKANGLYRKQVNILKNFILELKNSITINHSQIGNFIKQLLEKITNQDLGNVNKSQKKQVRQYGQQYHNSTKNQSVQFDTIIQNSKRQIELEKKVKQFEYTVKILKQQKQELQKQLETFLNSKNQKLNAIVHDQSYLSSSSSNSSRTDFERIHCIIYQALNCEGDFKKIHQQFLALDCQKKFQGNFISGMKSGLGICEYINNFSYQGTYLHGLKSGLGTLKHKQNILYRGYWKNDLPSGKGTFFFPFNQNIERISGIFQRGKFNGYASILYRSGEKIIANYSMGRPIDEKCLKHSELGLELAQYGKLKKLMMV